MTGRTRAGDCTESDLITLRRRPWSASWTWSRQKTVSATNFQMVLDMTENERLHVETKIELFNNTIRPNINPGQMSARRVDLTPFRRTPGEVIRLLEPIADRIVNGRIPTESLRTLENTLLGRKRELESIKNFIQTCKDTCNKEAASLASQASTIMSSHMESLKLRVMESKAWRWRIIRTRCRTATRRSLEQRVDGYIESNLSIARDRLRTDVCPCGESFDIVLWFGQHSGRTLSAIPHEYVVWLAGPSFNADTDRKRELKQVAIRMVSDRAILPR